jgi:hypothetical protein
MPGIHTCFASEFIRDQAVKEGAVKQTLTQTGQLRCLIRACQNRSITSKDGKTSSPLTFLLENRIKKQKEVLIKLNYSIKIIVKSRENQKLLRGSQFQLNIFLFNFQIFSRQFPAAFNFFLNEPIFLLRWSGMIKFLLGKQKSQGKTLADDQ